MLESWAGTPATGFPLQGKPSLTLVYFKDFEGNLGIGDNIFASLLIARNHTSLILSSDESMKPLMVMSQFTPTTQSNVWTGKYGGQDFFSAVVFLLDH